MRDLKYNLGTIHLLDPQAVTSTKASNILDVKGFDAALLVVQVGTVSGTNPSFTPALQHASNVNATAFSNVAATDMQGAFSAVTGTGNDQVTQDVGYLGSKRYLRVNTTVSGTNPSAVLGVLGLVGRPKWMPPTEPDPATAT